MGDVTVIDSKPQSLTLTSTAKHCAQWASTWKPYEQIPRQIADALPVAISEMASFCTGADPRTTAVALRTIWSWAKAFDAVPEPEVRDAANEHYRAVFSDIPADLLLEAIKRVRRVHKWPRRPTPADFYTAVQSEMFERKQTLRRLELALRESRYPGKIEEERP